MPGSSTKRRAGARASAMSARPRPMKRLTETMVFSGSSPCAASASWPIWRPPFCAGSARPTAGSRGPRRRAGTRARRGARPPPASGWCPGRCPPRGGAGADRATGRVRRSAAMPWSGPRAVLSRAQSTRWSTSLMNLSTNISAAHACRPTARQSTRVGARRSAPCSDFSVALRARASTSSASASTVVQRARPRERLAPFHLLHQEIRRHRRVASRPATSTPFSAQQVGGARQRIFSGDRPR